MIYLTTTICTSAVSVVVQIDILNIYHKAPLTPVPLWLKKIAQFSPCRSGCFAQSDVPKSPRGESTRVIMKSGDLGDANQGRKQTSGNNGVSDEAYIHADEVANRKIDEVLREEWQTVARIMDNIFFVIFVLLQVTLVIATFCIIPFVWIGMLAIHPYMYNVSCSFGLIYIAWLLVPGTLQCSYCLFCLI